MYFVLPWQLQWCWEIFSHCWLCRSNIPYQLISIVLERNGTLTRSSGRPILPRFTDIQLLRPLDQTLRRHIRMNSYSISNQSPPPAPKVRELTTTIIPILIKPNSRRHLRPHKPRMHNTDHNTIFLQIQTQQLPYHIQRRFTSMVCIIPSSLFLVP